MFISELSKSKLLLLSVAVLIYVAGKLDIKVVKTKKT